MTEKDLELEKIEKILYKEINVGYVSGGEDEDHDGSQVEGRDKAAKKLLKWHSAETVRVLERLSKYIPYAVIQSEINKLK